jgi:hypothetical protein
MMDHCVTSANRLRHGLAGRALSFAAEQLHAALSGADRPEAARSGFARLEAAVIVSQRCSRRPQFATEAMRRHPASGLHSSAPSIDPFPTTPSKECNDDH